MLRDIKNYVLKKNFSSLMIASLLIRLILIPLSFHSDLNNHAYWGIFGFEFGFRGFYDWLNFGVYARPDYPPLAMILFSFIRMIWFWLNNLIWYVNVHISIFPSNLVPWFETKGYLSMLKLPGMFGDLGIGYLIFSYFRKINYKKAIGYSSLYLLNPAVIYLSASWGQIDSFVAFFALLSLLSLIKQRYIKSFVAFFVSIMTKATWVPAALILLIFSIKNKITLKKIIYITIIFAIFLFVLGYIFFDANYIIWTVNLYLTKVIKGAVTLPYITINAFNFWAAILGIDKLPDSILIFNIPLYIWAWVMAIFFILLATIRFWKTKNIFFTLGIIYFAIFLFAPRIHERYLYPLFVLFPFIIAKYKNLTKYYLMLTLTFIINLYHWWWFPNITFLVNILSFNFVERTISLVNLGVFFLMFRYYLRTD